MKKRISALFPLIVMMFFFWLFPFQVKASEITTEGSSCISVNNRVEAMTTMTDTFQSLLPDGETEENFTATISGHLINSSLCEYYPLFRQVTEDNNWGNALFYKIAVSLDGAGNTNSYSNVVTTKPIELTLTIPKYLRCRPNRMFILLVKDSAGKIIELARGTKSITFETDFSNTWYDVSYVDEPSKDRIDFTVEKPVPGDRAGDPKYRPQTNSSLCNWDNNIAYTASYRGNNYRWCGIDPETGDGYALGEDEVFKEGERYSLQIDFSFRGDNPDIYINGHTPSWDIRNESGTWGEFSISNLDPEKESEKGIQETTEDSVAVLNHVCADSDYEWNTVQNATETTDGEMRYQCKICGKIKYSVPISAYYQLNANTVDKIKNAPRGGTVVIDTPVFVSFHAMVKDELAVRPDVNLVVNYKYKGTKYQMLIPANSTEKMSALFGKNKFCGFRNMSSVFATGKM